LTRRTIARRIRARLQGERGFTIVETVVAMVVIFGSLTALAYTATIGFKYISYGRDRQQATAYANRIMEEIRGQAYSVITRGMSTSDLTGDANIVSCSSVNRFESCSGPKVVATTVPGGTTAPWIIPHKSSSPVTIGNLDVSWATYVTNDDPTTSPYAVTVIVSWASGAISQGPNNIVRLQSNFWSPSGCVSSTTHPFAAPCQPFFYGLAQVPDGSITFTGDLHEGFVDFEEGVLTWPSAKALTQQEQVISTQADAIESRFSFEDTSGLEEGGETTAEYSGDSDPGSTVGVTAGGALAGAGDTAQRLQPDAGGEMGLRFDIPSGQIGNANVSTLAKATDAYACPPSGTRETDSLACAGAQVRQVNTVTATVPFTHVVNIGNARIARLAAPASYSTATAERDAVSGQNGLVDVQATRYLGDFYLGGFPTSGMTAPTGMSTTDTLATNYCMYVTGYNDTARVYAGARTATGPAASIGGGTFSYWNSSTNSYSSLAVTSSSLDTLAFTCSKTQSVSGSSVTWRVDVSSGGISHALVPAYTETTDATDTQIKKEVEATVQPITITFRYRLIVEGATEIDLTTVVNPGTLSARGVYGPPPAAG
jgi:type II secretory pathway pseudopilin PulG